jgi:hypothetical protein
MEQMEEYVKAQEKSNSPPSTVVRVGFKYCAQNDPKGGKRLKSYGPLIKRRPIHQTQQTQEHVSEQNSKESE